MRRSQNPLPLPYHSEVDFVLTDFLLDEISDVKEMSIDFVRKTLEKKGASFTYILVPFSDPGRYQGPVSRKPRKLFGPVKPWQNLEPYDYSAVLFIYFKDEGRFPSYKNFQANKLLRF